MRRMLIGLAVATFAAMVGNRLMPRWRRNAELSELTKEELYRRAQEADVAGRSEMTKDELIDALGRA